MRQLSLLVSLCLVLVMLSSASAWSDRRFIRLRSVTSQPVKAVNAFVTIGDWGCPNTWKGPHQRAKEVAAQLATVAEKNNADFIVSTGDNMYPAGVSSVDDEQFKGSFQDVFTAPFLQTRRWYMVLGNHDYLPNQIEGKTTNPQAQVDYTSKDPSKRWYLPDFRYSATFALPGDRTMFMLFMYTGTFELAAQDPSNQERQKAVADETAWYEEQLKKASASADYIMVVGHHNIMSAGEHGATSFVQAFKDMFTKYKVSAYLSGHEHILQHHEAGGVHYLGSGGGCQMQGRVKGDATFAQKANGFALHAFDERGIQTVKFIDQNGAVLHTVVINPRVKGA